MRYYVAAASSLEVERALMNALDASEDPVFEKHPIAAAASGEEVFEVVLSVDPIE